MEPPEAKKDVCCNSNGPEYFLLVVALIVSHTIIGWWWYGLGKDVMKESVEARERQAVVSAANLVNENIRKIRQQAVAHGYGEWTVDKDGSVNFSWKHERK